MSQAAGVHEGPASLCSPASALRTEPRRLPPSRAALPVHGVSATHAATSQSRYQHQAADRALIPHRTISAAPRIRDERTWRHSSDHGGSRQLVQPPRSPTSCSVAVHGAAGRRAADRRVVRAPPGWLLSISWRAGRSRLFPAWQCSSATRTSFVASGSDEPGRGCRDARQPRPEMCAGRWRCRGRDLARGRQPGYRPVSPGSGAGT